MSSNNFNETSSSVVVNIRGLGFESAALFDLIIQVNSNVDINFMFVFPYVAFTLISILLYPIGLEKDFMIWKWHALKYRRRLLLPVFSLVCMCFSGLAIASLRKDADQNNSPFGAFRSYSLYIHMVLTSFNVLFSSQRFLAMFWERFKNFFEFIISKNNLDFAHGCLIILYLCFFALDIRFGNSAHNTATASLAVNTIAVSSIYIMFHLGFSEIYIFWYFFWNTISQFQSYPILTIFVRTMFYLSLINTSFEYKSLHDVEELNLDNENVLMTGKISLSKTINNTFDDICDSLLTTFDFLLKKKLILECELDPLFREHDINNIMSKPFAFITQTWFLVMAAKASLPGNNFLSGNGRPSTFDEFAKRPFEFSFAQRNSSKAIDSHECVDEEDELDLPFNSKYKTKTGYFPDIVDHPNLDEMPSFSSENEYFEVKLFPLWDVVNRVVSIFEAANCHGSSYYISAKMKSVYMTASFGAVELLIYLLVCNIQTFSDSYNVIVFIDVEDTSSSWNLRFRCVMGGNIDDLPFVRTMELSDIYSRFMYFPIVIAFRPYRKKVLNPILKSAFHIVQVYLNADLDVGKVSIDPESGLLNCSQIVQISKMVKSLPNPKCKLHFLAKPEQKTLGYLPGKGINHIYWFFITDELDEVTETETKVQNTKSYSSADNEYDTDLGENADKKCGRLLTMLRALNIPCKGISFLELLSKKTILLSNHVFVLVSASQLSKLPSFTCSQIQNLNIAWIIVGNDSMYDPFTKNKMECAKIGRDCGIPSSASPVLFENIPPTIAAVTLNNGETETMEESKQYFDPGDSSLATSRSQYSETTEPSQYEYCSFPDSEEPSGNIKKTVLYEMEKVEVFASTFGPEAPCKVPSWMPYTPLISFNKISDPIFTADDTNPRELKKGLDIIGMTSKLMKAAINDIVQKDDQFGMGDTPDDISDKVETPPFDHDFSDGVSSTSTQKRWRGHSDPSVFVKCKTATAIDIQAKYHICIVADWTVFDFIDSSLPDGGGTSVTPIFSSSISKQDVAAQLLNAGSHKKDQDNLYNLLLTSIRALAHASQPRCMDHNCSITNPGHLLSRFNAVGTNEQREIDRPWYDRSKHIVTYKRISLNRWQRLLNRLEDYSLERKHYYEHNASIYSTYSTSLNETTPRENVNMRISFEFSGNIMNQLAYCSGLIREIMLVPSHILEFDKMKKSCLFEIAAAAEKKSTKITDYYATLGLKLKLPSSMNPHRKAYLCNITSFIFRPLLNLLQVTGLGKYEKLDVILSNFHKLTKELSGFASEFGLSFLSELLLLAHELVRCVIDLVTAVDESGSSSNITWFALSEMMDEIMNTFVFSIDVVSSIDAPGMSEEVY